MADLSTFKKKNLGTPPSLNDAGNNLSAPEVAPLDDSIDGRSLKKTGRTEQLATRVTAEFHKKVKMLAARDELKIVELLEKSIALYENKHGQL
ncbi:hypothetical protein [Crenothrix polyspora]|uniref:Uncharacterized protein n=1 Tax=Crenothrix polyspora TaxID=360316 RepID=A0A1R4HH21_9GAMM|nr:hypothetical protein [Crenothrix polyspora]SJM95532.1 conserved hypothetical protein [Crenothrix polyspora]